MHLHSGSKARKKKRGGRKKSRQRKRGRWRWQWRVYGRKRGRKIWSDDEIEVEQIVWEGTAIERKRESGEEVGRVKEGERGGHALPPLLRIVTMMEVEGADTAMVEVGVTAASEDHLAVTTHTAMEVGEEVRRESKAKARRGTKEERGMTEVRDHREEEGMEEMEAAAAVLAAAEVGEKAGGVMSEDGEETLLAAALPPPRFERERGRR
mmetsp:Transcript_34798/g.90245  ORF Transcript_34798/g.90245 Transcript_34798/m.90245 type:complete len:209 (-) Transcript_34798:113-739(-)